MSLIDNEKTAQCKEIAAGGDEQRRFMPRNEATPCRTSVHSHLIRLRFIRGDWRRKTDENAIELIN